MVEQKKLVVENKPAVVEEGRYSVILMFSSSTPRGITSEAARNHP